MSNTSGDPSTRPIPLRLWPGVVILTLQWTARFGVPLFVPEALGFKLFGALLGGLGILLWWLFFSRARWFERLGGLAVLIAVPVLTSYLMHKSMGVHWILFYQVPVLCLALVGAAVIGRRYATKTQRLTMVVTIVMVSLIWMPVRTDGVTGDHVEEFAWRWTETAEDRLLADSDEEHIALPVSATEVETDMVAQWPGFRGPNRDGRIQGVQIVTDWAKSPPTELWRRAVGPGWSSFAVDNDFFYTQEQRGDDEIVACYDISSGKPVWKHSDSARFWESMGGPGPRATPTYHEGRLYVFGATGILNALDAKDGTVIWSRNVSSDTEVEIPIWGFASSPLVVNDVVIIAAAGNLVGYERASGVPRWLGPKNRGDGYSSPHPFSIGGIDQVLLMDGGGITSVTPDSGNLLWEHAFESVNPIVQPAMMANGDLLISAGEGKGIRRISVALENEGWKVEERWTSSKLKADFNDFVIHQDHLFGFDGSILACIDLEDGQRKWKGGRYGKGQLVLLSDLNTLLVLTEKGELALVAATTDAFKEIARVPAINGKTWNHPVLVDGVLLVRNAQEAAAFRLALK